MTRGAGFADHGDLRRAGDDNPRQFGRGIGMRQAAADSAAIADLIMRDMRDGRDQQRMRRLQPRVLENVAPAHHGAERDAAIGDLDLPQLRKLAQIDQQRGSSDAKRQHRHETLAAGKRLGLAVMSGEEGDSLRDVWSGRHIRKEEASSTLRGLEPCRTHSVTAEKDVETLTSASATGSNAGWRMFSPSNSC